MSKRFTYHNRQKLNNPFNGYPDPGPFLSLNTLNVSYINLLSGASGPFPGVVGPTGYQGYQGYQGHTGYQGLPGSASNTGATGYQGYQGATGYQGYQGATGAGGTLGYYGVFYDTTSQIATVANTGYAMTFNNTAESFGVSMVAGRRLTFSNRGTYNIQFSAQLTQSSNAVNRINIWLRQNGVDLPDTNTNITMDRKNGDKVAAWNFMYTLNANDYLELIWQTDDVTSYLAATGAYTGAYFFPATPSIILTASQVAYSIIGPTGTTGYQGYQGFQGAGYQGSTGPTGYQGYQGYQGATGYQGVAGNVSGGVTLYLDGPTTTYAGTTIQDQSILIPDLSAQTSLISGPQNNTTIQIADFLSPTGVLSSTVIPGGLWDLNIFASSSNSSVSFYYGVAYVDQNGTSNRVNMATGTVGSATPFSSLTSQLYTSSLYVPTTVVPDVTKRIIISLFFYFSSGGNRTATLYMRDSTNSHIHTTLISPQSVGTYWGDYQYWNPTTNNWNIGSESIVLGRNAGYTGQATYAVAVGYQAGQTNQGTSAIAIGNSAGRGTQGQYSVAMGYFAGYANQLSGAVSIGYQAGSTSQQQFGIAIGNLAGAYSQGASSIAIGSLSGQTNQVANSIVLNASGVALNAATQGLFVNPIRGATFSNVLGYNSSTSEILYSAKSFVINHPVKEDRYLVHACLEGPEAGVYYRGKSEIKNNREVEVQLPYYASKLAKDFTIQITPIFDGDSRYYSCSEVVDNKFMVYGGNGKFFWTVHGSRQDIDVEPRVEDVVLKGVGPYRWVQNARE